MFNFPEMSLDSLTVVYSNSSTDGCMILNMCELKCCFSHTEVYFGVDYLDDLAVENAFLSSVELACN